ncbi:MAG: hypothetical protein AB7N76_30520 [Planctomycetota bacterium]
MLRIAEPLRAIATLLLERHAAAARAERSLLVSDQGHLACDAATARDATLAALCAGAFAASRSWTPRGIHALHARGERLGARVAAPFPGWLIVTCYALDGEAGERLPPPLAAGWTAAELGVSHAFLLERAGDLLAHSAQGAGAGHLEHDTTGVLAASCWGATRSVLLVLEDELTSLAALSPTTTLRVVRLVDQRLLATLEPGEGLEGDPRLEAVVVRRIESDLATLLSCVRVEEPDDDAAGCSARLRPGDAPRVPPRDGVRCRLRDPRLAVATAPGLAGRRR